MRATSICDFELLATLGGDSLAALSGDVVSDVSLFICIFVLVWLMCDFGFAVLYYL